MPDAESVVRQFFESCAEPGNLIGAAEQHLADECVWENTGLPTATGIEEIKGAWQHFIQTYSMHAMIVDVRAIAAAGDVVVTERVDHFDDANGERVASVAVAGTFEVRDGRIVAWRDYFDPRPFLGEG